MKSEHDSQQEVVHRLLKLIRDYGWREKFEQAIDAVHKLRVDGISHITNLEEFLEWLDIMLTKPPRFVKNRQDFYEDVCAFYLFLNQEPVQSLQTPILPSSQKQQLSPLSEWMVQVMKSWGSFLDTTDSAKYVQTFKEDLMFNWDDYMEPPSGYLTFNQFFGRHVKPGRRPIADIANPKVIVSPADSTFVGSWEIDEDSDIYVEKVLNLKGLKWSIAELLYDSPYKDAFNGGIFCHSFLSVGDYHRFHSPVEGKVLESRVIKGQTSSEVTIVERTEGQSKIRALEAVDGTGFQFVQMRGLVVIDSPIGLVACLPIGMAIVSSIVLTAEQGLSIRKGEELGYFQAGGSDFVLVFQKESNVGLSWKEGVKAKQGEAIGVSHA